jgi:hypothetical protein
MPILGIIASSISGNLTGDRGFVMGGATSGPYTSTIQYNTITTSANYATFGTLSRQAYLAGVAASSTRGIYAQGFAGAYPASRAIEYITMSTLGNTTSFGSVTQTQSFAVASSYNATRGIFSGGYDNGVGYYGQSNYITIATTGDTTAFGALFRGQTLAEGSGSSQTRGITYGGDAGGCSSYTNTIYYVTIATTGAWVSFATLFLARTQAPAVFSSTRIVIMGGTYDPCVSPYATANMEYITTATLANGTSFGTLSAISSQGACTNNAVLGNVTGGYSAPWATIQTYIKQITIATLGNGTTMSGVTTVGVVGADGISNCHGAL